MSLRGHPTSCLTATILLQVDGLTGLQRLVSGEADNLSYDAPLPDPAVLASSPLIRQLLRAHVLPGQVPPSDKGLTRRGEVGET
jgi:hypothetical protein